MGIFDLIKEKMKENKEKRAQDDALKREILNDSKDEIKAAAKEVLVKEEVDRLTAPKKNPLQTLANEFKALPGTLNTDEKLKTMVGQSPSNRINPSVGFGRAPVIDHNDYIDKKSFPTIKDEYLKKIKKEAKEETNDEKLRRMIRG